MYNMIRIILYIMVVLPIKFGILVFGLMFKFMVLPFTLLFSFKRARKARKEARSAKFHSFIFALRMLDRM